MVPFLLVKFSILLGHIIWLLTLFACMHWYWFCPCIDRVCLFISLQCTQLEGVSTCRNMKVERCIVQYIELPKCLNTVLVQYFLSTVQRKMWEWPGQSIEKRKREKCSDVLMFWNFSLTGRWPTIVEGNTFSHQQAKKKPCPYLQCQIKWMLNLLVMVG